MKRFLIIIGLIVLFLPFCFGQQKTNPVLYTDLGFSAPTAGISGIEFNTSVNYQYDKSLFTFRLAAIKSYTLTAAPPYSFVVFPEFKDAGSLGEVGLLYGRRFVRRGHSFSISAGLSYNNRSYVFYSNNMGQSLQYRYAGVPFEMNILWFKAQKLRYHIYGLVPVGKPTAFGHSFGFKFSGNVSQHSYAAFGIVFGFGWHKEY